MFSLEDQIENKLFESTCEKLCTVEPRYKEVGYNKTLL